jgi:peptidylprolyl isomerase
MNAIKYLLIFSIIFFSAFTSFGQKKIKYKKTPSGLGYKIITTKKGLQALPDNRLYISYNLFYQATDTSAIKEVMTGGNKEFILGQDDVLPGWNEGFLLMKEGDSAAFKIPFHLGYGDKKMGKIPAKSTLFLFAKLLKVQEAFYSHKGLDTIRFASGLKKLMVKSSAGEKSQALCEVRMKFTGYVYSTKGFKKVFESSQTNSAEAQYQIGVGRFIKGLDEGIATMRIGEKSTFIVPSYLGYGDKLTGKILPNTTLYYDIELLSSSWPFLKPLNTDTLLLKDSVKLVISEKSELKQITIEDIVTINTKVYKKNEDGVFAIFDNTFERAQTATIRPGSGKFFPGVEDALLGMKVGEKATAIIPYKLANSKKKITGLIKNSSVYFDLYIENVTTYPFLKITTTDTLTSPTGLRSLYNDTGNGEATKTGDSVNVAYTVYFIEKNGVRHILDATRDSGKRMKLKIGAGKNIIGFEEGLIGMKIGSTKRLIIPPALGYGEKGLPENGLPARTDLIFDIEFLEIIK